jgi:hypothetical protein
MKANLAGVNVRKEVTAYEKDQGQRCDCECREYASTNWPVMERPAE